MMNLWCPPHIAILADLTKDLYRELAGCSYYLALKMLFEFFFNEYDSVSELLRRNSWAMSESHFLSLILQFDGNRLMRRMRRSVLSKYRGELNPNDFILAVDDTDNPKYSKYLSNVQTWRCSKGSYYGQKVLVIALVHRKKKVTIPLYFRMCIPKKLQKDENAKSGIDQAFEIIVDACQEFKNIPVVADSWFDSSELAENLRAKGITYVWEIKSNRKVKAQPGRHIQWKTLAELFTPLQRFCVNKKKNKWISESIIVLNSRKMQVKAIAGFNRKNGKDPFAYYATTDRTMPGARVWEIFRARWSIECLFFDLKNHLNFGRLSSSNDGVNELALVIPFVIYTYLRINPNAFGLPDGMTTAGMLKTLTTKQDCKTIDALLEGRHKNQVGRLKKMRSRINQKPVMQGTEAI